jgi:hypothetical protein
VGVATARPQPAQVEASRAAANTASLASDVEAPQSGRGRGRGYGAEHDALPGDPVGDVSGGAFGDAHELEDGQTFASNGELSVKHAGGTARPSHVSSTQLFSYARQVRLGHVTQAQDEEREENMATGLGDDAGLGPETPLSSPGRGSSPYAGAGAGQQPPTSGSGGDGVGGEAPPPKSPHLMPAPEDEG